jgi:hypothetical protein
MNVTDIGKSTLRGKHVWYERQLRQHAFDSPGFRMWQCFWLAYVDARRAPACMANAIGWASR